VLQRLDAVRKLLDPYVLVLVPSRELVVQVSQAFHRYGRELWVRVLAIYGG
jgi:ATP-dependent RNA helicase DeaD